eukprot:TRINITY_DN5715_c0_g1_i1.p1 TRINITY_DN5715_c0_g1~~TRINITY_DN5715_c0_g1_i1.p1  ORF type:complete len:124 (-),score=48.25 TRINITY_DN5715_c0_g1_i1:9-326(-)
MQSNSESIRIYINQKLLETGEKERLKDMLRTKLVECGWRDEMKNYCKETVKSKGVENITVDEIVNEVLPRGRAQVPAAIKTELLTRIRKFLAANSTIATPTQGYQ